MEHPANTRDPDQAIPYDPEKGRPSPTHHALMLSRWSMFAGSLVLITIVAGRFLGLEKPAAAPPLITLIFLYVCLTPIAYYVHSHSETLTDEQDRRWSAAIIGLDIVAGWFVLFFTGGPESIYLLLAPVVPFTLRLLASIRYTIAYAFALAVGLSAIVLMQAYGALPHGRSLLDNPYHQHIRVEIVLAITTIGIVVASVLMANSLAHLLRRKENEAHNFSRKMNLRAEKLSLLLRVGSLVSRSKDFEGIARRALAHIHEHFGAETTVLYLMEPAGEKLEIFHALGPVADQEAEENTLALTTIGSGRARLWPSILPESEDRQSAMVVPLLAENTCYGALKVVGPPGESYNQSKLALLDTLTSELSATLHTADVYRQTNAALTRSADELSALTRYTRKVNSTLELENICRDLLDTARIMTDSDYAQVALFAYGEDTEEVALFSNYPEEVECRLRETRRTPDRRMYGRAFETGRAVVVADLEGDSDARPSAPDALSKLCAPIVLGGVVEGMVVLESTRPNAYSDSDIDFVTALAESTAVAVKNAQLYRKVQQLAIRDGLTSLFDHSHFHHLIEEEVERSHRYERSLSLIMIDVDDFKIYNDAYGHPAGDRVLAWFGRTLNHRTRKVDIAARYGGEEFAILMPETNPDEARVAAENLRYAIETQQPREWPGSVTVSLGISSLPEDTETAAGMISIADQRMYRAKEEGKNQVVASG